ncbi:hypothetical protein SAMN06295888_12351 [Desulfonatronum zhilinae]|nr:hypothetical protein SAMN06295888_12351 [Desulfonatronum zhilinae]
MTDKDFQLILAWINDLDEAQRNALHEALQGCADFEKVVGSLNRRPWSTGSASIANPETSSSGDVRPESARQKHDALH